MRETIQRVMATEDAAMRLVAAAREEGEALEAEGILTAAVEEARREKEERIRQASAEIEATIRLDEDAARQAVDAIVRCVCGRGEPWR